MEMLTNQQILQANDNFFDMLVTSTGNVEEVIAVQIVLTEIGSKNPQIIKNLFSQNFIDALTPMIFEIQDIKKPSKLELSLIIGSHMGSMIKVFV